MIENIEAYPTQDSITRRLLAQECVRVVLSAFRKSALLPFRAPQDFLGGNRSPSGERVVPLPVTMRA